MLPPRYILQKAKMLVLVFTIIFLQNQGFAVPLQEEDLVSLASEIPQKLVDAGLFKIGKFDLQDLLKKLNDPNFVKFHLQVSSDTEFAEKGAGPGLGLVRYGGQCFDKTKGPETHLGKKLLVNGGLVIIDNSNIARLAANREQLSFLLLHEGLCAIYGVATDDHYQISSWLAFLAYLKKQLALQTIVNDPTQTVFVQSLFPEQLAGGGGGVTGGSGGGDPSAAFVKPLLYGIFFEILESCKTETNSNPACLYLKLNTEKIWIALTNLRIEVNNDEQTNCRESKGVANVLMQSIAINNSGDSLENRVLYLYPCSVQELLKTYESTTVAINLMKLFWILCLYNKDFPQTDFTAENLLIFSL
jgi:hypothetical protein